ncbi:MAG: 6-bladed beta-propeller [Prevotella sp.]
MKRILLIHTIIFTVLLFASCTDGRQAKLVESAERKEISNKTVVLDIEKNVVDSFPLSKFITDIRYVQLETPTEACLTVPMNIKIANEIIYVSDLDEHLFCYDKDGKFLRKAFRNGKGHGEVLRMYDFDVDDSLLYVLDGTRSSILTYRHDGTFVENKTLPFRAISFARQEKGYIFQMAPYGMDGNDNESIIAVTDDVFSLLYTSFKYNLKKSNPVKRTPYFTNGNNPFLYAPIYGRSIYVIDENGIYMKYYLSFQSPYYEQNKQLDGAKEAAEQKICYSYDNPLQYGDVIIQNFVTSNECKGVLLIDKKTNNYVFIKNFIQDSNRVFDFNMGMTKYYDKNKNELVGFANIYYKDVHKDEIEVIKKTMTDSISSILIKESEAFSENPLIMFYRICPDVI